MSKTNANLKHLDTEYTRAAATHYGARNYAIRAVANGGKIPQHIKSQLGNYVTEKPQGRVSNWATDNEWGVEF